MRNFLGLTRWFPLFFILPWLAACGGEGSNGDSGSTADAVSQAPVAGDACDLLDVEEVGRIYGKPVEERNDESGPDWSSCSYTDVSDETVAALGDYVPESGGLFVMGFTVYYAGGRDGWKTWHAARGAARTLIKQNEGVDVDTIVSPGYVLALGDAAYFNELLPSQVLIGDTLIEFKMPFLPEPERHFRALAEGMINRLRTGSED